MDLQYGRVKLTMVLCANLIIVFLVAITLQEHERYLRHTPGKQTFSNVESQIAIAVCLWLLASFLPRPKEFGESITQDLVVEPHMFAGRRPELETALPVELPKAEPVFRVKFTSPQRCDFGTVDLLKPSRLFRDCSCVIFEHVHDQVVQPTDVLFILGVLDWPLVVDVGQEVGMLQILVVLFWIAEVLRRHKSGLHKITPRITLQKGHGTTAHPISVTAFPECSDAIVLGPEGK